MSVLHHRDYYAKLMDKWVFMHKAITLSHAQYLASQNNCTEIGVSVANTPIKTISKKSDGGQWNLIYGEAANG